MLEQKVLTFHTDPVIIRCQLILNSCASRKVKIWMMFSMNFVWLNESRSIWCHDSINFLCILSLGPLKMSKIVIGLQARLSTFNSKLPSVSIWMFKSIDIQIEWHISLNLYKEILIKQKLVTKFHPISIAFELLSSSKQSVVIAWCTLQFEQRKWWFYHNLIGLRKMFAFVCSPLVRAS